MFTIAPCLNKAVRERGKTVMPNQIIFKKRDFDGDKQQSSVTVNDAATPIASATNSAIVGLNLWLAGAEAGTFHQTELTADTGNNASSPVEQGALQLIVEMIDDDNGRTYKERLPIPDLAKAADGSTNAAWVVSGGLTIANPDHADYATTKAAIEAVWESPLGNDGTLARMYIEE